MDTNAYDTIVDFIKDFGPILLGFEMNPAIAILMMELFG
jgi:hypothetical protein